MGIELKNFAMHRAVVFHQVADNNADGARKYVEALGSRITSDLPHDPVAKEGIGDLRGYLTALEAAAILAEKQGKDLDDYFEDLCPN
jgi:hypothetical protein